MKIKILSLFLLTISIFSLCTCSKTKIEETEIETPQTNHNQNIKGLIKKIRFDAGKNSLGDVTEEMVYMTLNLQTDKLLEYIQGHYEIFLKINEKKILLWKKGKSQEIQKRKGKRNKGKFIFEIGTTREIPKIAQITISAQKGGEETSLFTKSSKIKWSKKTKNEFNLSLSYFLKVTNNVGIVEFSVSGTNSCEIPENKIKYKYEVYSYTDGEKTIHAKNTTSFFDYTQVKNIPIYFKIPKEKIFFIRIYDAQNLMGKILEDINEMNNVKILFYNKPPQGLGDYNIEKEKIQIIKNKKNEYKLSFSLYCMDCEIKNPVVASENIKVLRFDNVEMPLKLEVTEELMPGGMEYDNLKKGKYLIFINPGGFMAESEIENNFFTIEVGEK